MSLSVIGILHHLNVWPISWLYSRINWILLSQTFWSRTENNCHMAGKLLGCKTAIDSLNDAAELQLNETVWQVSTDTLMWICREVKCLFGQYLSNEMANVLSEVRHTFIQKQKPPAKHYSSPMLQVGNGPEHTEGSLELQPLHRRRSLLSD